MSTGMVYIRMYRVSRLYPTKYIHCIVFPHCLIASTVSQHLYVRIASYSALTISEEQRKDSASYSVSALESKVRLPLWRHWPHRSN